MLISIGLSRNLNSSTHHYGPLAPLAESGVSHTGHSVVELTLHDSPEVIMIIMMILMMVTFHLRSSRLEKYPRSLVVPRTLKMYSVLSRLTSRLRLW